MKTWLINYSVKYNCDSGGSPNKEERRMQLRASTMAEAYNVTRCKILENKKVENISEFVIWGVCIVDDDVWDD